MNGTLVTGGGDGKRRWMNEDCESFIDFFIFKQLVIEWSKLQPRHGKNVPRKVTFYPNNYSQRPDGEAHACSSHSLQPWWAEKHIKTKSLPIYFFIYKCVDEKQRFTFQTGVKTWKSFGFHRNQEAKLVRAEVLAVGWSVWINTMPRRKDISAST